MVGVVAAALCTRSEAPLVLSLSLGAAASLFAFAGDGPRARRVLVLLGATLALSALLLAWRHHTFGALFPLPTEAKTGRNWHAVIWGASYLLLEGRGASTPLVMVLGLRGLSWLATPRIAFGDPTRALVHAFGMVHLAFVASMGGDWMVGGRFFVALIPLATISALDLLGAVRWRRAALVALAGWNLFGLATLAIATDATLWSFPPSDEPALAGRSFFETHHFDHRNFIRALPAVDAALADVRRRTGRKPVVMSKCAGVPFFYLARDHFREVRLLDLQGLTTPEFTRCPSLRSLRHDSLGVRLHYPEYARRRHELAAACGAPMPDIVFDLYDRGLEPDRESVIEGMGYRITARIPSEHLEGVGVLVAVRTDLP
ncbi:MAG: hypothetical protein EXR72_11900 [Myxococcales bacterium]|nr:hypothetical protein [Myxococcales bacterium]